MEHCPAAARTPSGYLPNDLLDPSADCLPILHPPSFLQMDWSWTTPALTYLDLYYLVSPLLCCACCGALWSAGQHGARTRLKTALPNVLLILIHAAHAAQALKR